MLVSRDEFYSKFPANVQQIEHVEFRLNHTALLSTDLVSLDASEHMLFQCYVKSAGRNKRLQNCTRAGHKSLDSVQLMSRLTVYMQSVTVSALQFGDQSLYRPIHLYSPQVVAINSYEKGNYIST